MSEDTPDSRAWLRVAVPVAMAAASALGVGIWYVAQINDQIAAMERRTLARIEQIVANEQAARRDLQIALTAQLERAQAHRAEVAKVLVADILARFDAANRRMERIERMLDEPDNRKAR